MCKQQQTSQYIHFKRDTLHNNRIMMVDMTIKLWPSTNPITTMFTVFVNNNLHPWLICISNTLVDMYMKLHKHLCNIHVNNNNLHNKLKRKILLDITICKQCTFHVNNCILNQHYSGEIHLHRTGECLFIAITCPSTNPILGTKPPLLLHTW